MTSDRLDDSIEQWLKGKFSNAVDFDIHKGLTHLRQLSTTIKTSDGGAKKASILTSDDQGLLNVSELQEALSIIDTLWDNAFPFSGQTTVQT